MIIQQTTKVLLAESLKELAKFKAVDKITIRELTKNCGLTPPTFYNHFRDKYDLMAWIYNRQAEELMKNFGSPITFEQVVWCIIEIVLADEEFYSNVLKNAVGQNSFRYATNDYSIKLTEEWIKARHNLDELPDDIQFHVKFYMRGFADIFVEWFLGKRKPPPQELARLIVEAMPAPLKPLLLQT